VKWEELDDEHFAGIQNLFAEFFNCFGERSNEAIVEVYQVRKHVVTHDNLLLFLAALGNQKSVDKLSETNRAFQRISEPFHPLFLVLALPLLIEPLDLYKISLSESNEIGEVESDGLMYEQPLVSIQRCSRVR
jgi:hypothetical protein